MRVESRFFEDAVHDFMLCVAGIGVHTLATSRANIGGRIFERNSGEIFDQFLTKTRQFQTVEEGRR
jgi:hypothetical protein